METTEISLSDNKKTEGLFHEWKECCRICHFEKGRLLKLCDCKGSLAFVHEKCQLKWLQVKESTKCEICASEMCVEKVNKDFSDWISLKGNKFRTYLLIDIICGVVVAPVFIWTVYMVLLSSYITESKVTISMLWGSLIIHFLMIVLWLWVCYFHHSTGYQKWSSKHHKYILKPKTEAISGLDESQPNSGWYSLFGWFNRNANNPQTNQI